MALIKCPFCGAVISDKARSCIKCHNSMSDPTVAYSAPVNPAGTENDTVGSQAVDTGKRKPIKTLVIATICVFLGYVIFLFTRYNSFRDMNNDAINYYNSNKDYDNKQKQQLLSCVNGIENVMEKVQKYATSEYSDYYDEDDYNDLYKEYIKYGSSVPRFYFDPYYNTKADSILYHELLDEYKDIVDQYSKKYSSVVDNEIAIQNMEAKQSWGFFKWFFDTEYWIGVLVILLVPIIIGIFIRSATKKDDGMNP